MPTRVPYACWRLVLRTAKCRSAVRLCSPIDSKGSSPAFACVISTSSLPLSRSERGARVCRALARVAVSSLVAWNSAELFPA
jgi:hypothetical protein